MEEKVNKLTQYLMGMYESHTTWTREACLHSPIAELGANGLLVLEVLDCGDRLNMGALSEKTGLPLSTLTGITDKLVDRGLLERLRSERDRRVVEVAMSSAGRTAYAYRKEAHRSKSRHVLSKLTVAEQKQLLTLLAKIVSK